MMEWMLSVLLLLALPPSYGAAAASCPSTPHTIAPKVFIIDMFVDEGDAWYGNRKFNVLEHNITVPGFSPLFPQAHCTKDGSICQVVTGEGEINAASTISALVHSPAFNLTRTYFLIAGIAGVSPKLATLGSVTFARFGVQVALQYEFDAREKPTNFSTGYVPQGAFAPGQYPQALYGTEVIELNDALRQVAIKMAKGGKLLDDAPSREYRARYARHPSYVAGAAPPCVVACDTATADAFWTGNLLAAAFENTTALFTNGTATYCSSQQEDNATLEALLRGAHAGLLDFARIILMRTASDFDRPAPGQSAADNLFVGTPGFEIAIGNIAAAGVPVVTGIVEQWHERFAAGIAPENYVGDIFGTLGGTPDFGPGSVFGGKPAPVKRALRRRQLPSIQES